MSLIWYSAIISRQRNIRLAYITQYEATPERFADGMQEVVTTLRMVIEKQGAPRSIDLALTGFWFCSFAGSLLSAFLSAIIKIFGKRN